MSSPVDPDLIVTRPASLAHLFRERVASSRDAVAYHYPVGEEWRQATWDETGDLVNAMAAGLVAIGVGPQEPVAIMSGTRFEWILADLAIMCAGAATTTIYPSTVDRDVVHILNDCGARVVIAEDDEQVHKLWRILDQVPRLARVVQLEGEFERGTVIPLGELVRIGRQEVARRPHLVDERIDGIHRDQLATIMYTSGTTGTPKGVRLRHSSWTYEGAAIASYGILDEHDLQFLWLPLSHSFGKVLLSTQLACGFPTAVDGRVERIIDNLPVVRPTFMGAAPRIFEKAYGRITAMTEEEGRRQEAGLRPGVRGRAPRQEVRDRGEARALPAPASSRPHGQARLRQDPRAVRRPAPVLHLRSGRAQHRHRRVLRARRRHHPRGLRAHRDVGRLVRRACPTSTRSATSARPSRAPRSPSHPMARS